MCNRGSDRYIQPDATWRNRNEICTRRRDTFETKTVIHALMALTRQVLLSVDVDRQVVVEHVIGVVQEGQHAHGDHQLVRAEVEGAGELVLVRAGVL